MKVIVTGTGRCGTGFMARVLTEAGIPCGHERVFTHWGDVAPQIDDPQLADASWMAVPWLVHHPAALVLLPYRTPEQVLGSFLGIGFYAQPSVYRTFVYREFPHIEDLRPIEAVNAHYQIFNTQALKRADIVFPVDDPPWQQIADALDLTEWRLRRAAEKWVGYNHRERVELNPELIHPDTHRVHQALQHATTK